MDLPDAWRKGRNRQRKRIDGTVPADDIERRMPKPIAVPSAPTLHREHVDALVARARELGRPKIAMRVRRIHLELPRAIPIRARERERARKLEPEPRLHDARVRHETMHDALRHVHVVTARECELAERRAEHTAALE